MRLPPLLRLILRRRAAPSRRMAPCSGADMLSRVADSLYWMSRYLERAEHVSRLLAVRLDTAPEQREQQAVRSWRRLSASLWQPAPEALTLSPFAVAEAMTRAPGSRSSILHYISAA